MKIKKIELDYDEEADVMYISFGSPKEAITEEKGNVGIRIDEKTKEIVGLTVINFKQTFSKPHKPITVSVPKAMEAE